jgi:hypothetical protein
MTLEPQAQLPARPSRTSTLMPLVWLVVAAALAVTTLMFAPVPPL